MEKKNEPKVLLISQWPNVKNAEYELIEKIRRTGFEIRVVDYLGFDVESGECINSETLCREYDFAISFHFDTPKFLNITTYLWVANPLEYMHLRHDYRNVLMHNYRAYDDYLYNGSDYLKEHIKRLLGEEWVDSGIAFFPACSQKVIKQPDNRKLYSDKIFYCGINWERGSDSSGRAHGLLELLEKASAADFYGPKELDGINTWIDFSSYKGEIPFDGISMSTVMQDYAAVLAISSPAHIKSKTSSSRVFEGFAAGVPVISDANEHVQKLFGDLVYYFHGETAEEKSASIISLLQHIKNHPDEALIKVNEAQKLLYKKYSFDECMVQALVYKEDKIREINLSATDVEMFLFHHDSGSLTKSADEVFDNLGHVKSAVEELLRYKGQAKVTIVSSRSHDLYGQIDEHLTSYVQIIEPEEFTDRDWDKLKLGEKVSILSQKSEAQYVSFLTQASYIHHDHLTKAVTYYLSDKNQSLYVSGFYVNSLLENAPLSSSSIPRYNKPTSMYEWSQNSLAEHEISTLVLPKSIFTELTYEKINSFDVLVPIFFIFYAETMGYTVYRSRFITSRVRATGFHQHYEAFLQKQAVGFWATHYELVTNYSHELNAMYDCFHESDKVIARADAISGHSVLPTQVIDPAVVRVNNFIEKIRPYYRKFKKLKARLKL